MVRGLRLARWAGAALAILSAGSAPAQQLPRAQRFSTLLVPISSPDPTLRPLAGYVLDAVKGTLRAQAAPGQMLLVFRRDDPAVARALREHPYLELPADDQISAALADALGVAMRMDTTLSGRLEPQQDGAARLILRAAGVRSRMVRRHTAAAPLTQQLRADLTPESAARWASALVEPAVRALAPQLPLLAAALPADPEEHLREGERLFTQGQFARAVVEYDMASAASPDEPIYYLALARAYRALGDPRTALLEVRRALRLQPDLVSARVLLGEVYADLGRLEAATEAFQQAALAEPRSSDALRGLARVYRAQGQDDMALAHYQRLLALDPEDLDALLAAASAAEGLGYWAQAADYLRRARALDPARTDLCQRLIDLYRRQGDRAAAVAALKQAQEAGVQMRYDAAQFVGMARMMEAEAADIIGAAGAHLQETTGRRAALALLSDLRRRSDALALAAEGLRAPEPLLSGHRHRVLAFHQLNQSNYEAERYVQTRERQRYTRSLLLRDAAATELAKARELDADAGWPIVTAQETEGEAGSPGP